ncbi:MAG: hypothetical protein J1F66_04185 [Clostridiales bacterium]|nr:hypothetical protein [Clostridiales bacterium]
MPFALIRILDREWAERLADGEIFMRSLSELGSWRAVENKDDPSLSNHFRGDIAEGTVKVVKTAEEDSFLKLLPDVLKQHIKQARIIDQGDIRYFNTLCLYRLEYNAKQRCYDTPSPRLKDFGNTAVVITHPNWFLERLLKTVNSGKYAFLLNNITYYSQDKTRTVNPLFNKVKGYSYQNELRIAVGRLDATKMLSDGTYPLIQSEEPLKIYTVSLRDIVQLVPIDAFLSGQWQQKKVNRVDLSQKNCLYTQAMRATDIIMSNYKSNRINYTIDI